MSDARPGPPDGELELRVGGQVFTGWTSVSVTRGVERIPSDFDIRATVKQPGELRARIKLGQPLQILIGGHVVLTGYLERITQHTAPEQHSVTLIGRGRCCDLVDTAALIDNQQRSNTSVGVLARELVQPYAGPIQVLTPDGDGDAKNYSYSINLGESPYELIERMARFEGLLCYENADGNLVLSRIGRETHSSGFVEGENIETLELVGTVDERFSVYIPVLTSSDTLSGRLPGTSSNPIGGTAAGEPVYDREIDRYRPRVIVSEQNTNETFLARQRCVWEAARRRGRSSRVSLSCSSWLDSAGEPWTPNRLATVSFASAGFADVTFVITDVVYRRDGRSGTTAHVTLMPPEAISVEPSSLNALDARFASPRQGPQADPLGPGAPAAPPTSAANAMPPGPAPRGAN